MVLQQSRAVGQPVDGATSTAGASRGNTTTILGLVIFPTADPTMGHLAAIRGGEMVKTTGSALVLYVDPLDISPSSAPRATSPKHACFYHRDNVLKKSQWDVYPDHHLVMLLKLSTISKIEWLLL